ncbi:IS4 family transposase [Primorskyibacter sedentarius]|uniref:IS4 family transposase n=1 Tax=Primorskyibacter sedentarius TaxID=745311 RepID=A0A4R3JI02_9RHOB|nr:IS5 family transposase [Primorskyibacter sedentarius]TCS65627.1 IS4 family transposase [Primorskyibacter sedentarius]
MRGTDETSGSLFSYVDLEERIPPQHPLRKIRQVVNDALASLDDDFDQLYADFGRPSIAPERLIRASLIQILFLIRSERQLMEQMQYNLLFRWFVGLGIDDQVWVPTMFTKNRDRLLTTDMSRKVLAAILAHREVAPLLSDEHFSVDGTLIKAWASMKSFEPKAEGMPPDDERPGDPLAHDFTPDDHPEQTQPETEPMPRSNHRNRNRNAEVDFKGEKRSNATHASTTGAEARLYKKSPGTGAVLCFMGHALMENRHGLIVQGDLTQADGHAERKAALDMVHRHSPGSTRRLTLGADKGYDAAEFVSDLRQACVTPHVARKARYSAINGRTTRHGGYALSLKHRKKIEEAFGYAKTVGGMAQTVYRGVERVRSRFILMMAANNLARLPRLLGA